MPSPKAVLEFFGCSSNKLTDLNLARGWLTLSWRRCQAVLEALGFPLRPFWAWGLPRQQQRPRISFERRTGYANHMKTWNWNAKPRIGCQATVSEVSQVRISLFVDSICVWLFGDCYGMCVCNILARGPTRHTVCLSFFLKKKINENPSTAA